MCVCACMSTLLHLPLISLIPLTLTLSISQSFIPSLCLSHARASPVYLHPIPIFTHLSHSPHTCPSSYLPVFQHFDPTFHYTLPPPIAGDGEGSGGGGGVVGSGGWRSVVETVPHSGPLIPRNDLAIANATHHTTPAALGLVI